MFALHYSRTRHYQDRDESAELPEPKHASRTTIKTSQQSDDQSDNIFSFTDDTPADTKANDNIFDFTASDDLVANTSAPTGPNQTPESPSLSASDNPFGFASPPASLSPFNTFDTDVEGIFDAPPESPNPADALASNNLQNDTEMSAGPDDTVQITAPEEQPVADSTVKQPSRAIMRRFGFPLQWIMRATHAILLRKKPIPPDAKVTVSLGPQVMKQTLRQENIVGVHATEAGRTLMGKYPRLLEGEVYRVREVKSYFVNYLQHQTFSTFAFPNVWLPGACVSTIIPDPGVFICGNVFCKATNSIKIQKCSSCQQPRPPKHQVQPEVVFGVDVPKLERSEDALVKEMVIAAARDDEPLVMLAMLEKVRVDLEDECDEGPQSISYNRVYAIAKKYKSFNCIPALEAYKKQKEELQRQRESESEPITPKPVSELIPEEELTRPFDHRAVREGLSVIAVSKGSLGAEKARSLVSGASGAAFNVLTNENKLSWLVMEGGLIGDGWLQAQLTPTSGTLYVHIFVRAHRSRRWRSVSRHAKITMKPSSSPFSSGWHSLYCIPRQGISGIRLVFKNADPKRPATITQLRIARPDTSALDKALCTPGMFSSVVEWLFAHAAGLTLSDTLGTLVSSPGLDVIAMFRNGVPAATETERLKRVAAFCRERGTYNWDSDLDAELVRSISARCRTREVASKHLRTMYLTRVGIVGGKRWHKYSPSSTELTAYPLMRQRFSQPDSKAFKRQMQCRYYEICVLNHFLELLEPFVLSARACCTPTSLDFVQHSIAPMLRVISNGRHLMLGKQHELWHRSIMRSVQSQVRREILKVTIKKYDGEMTVDQTYFGQCFAQIHPVSTERLLTPQAWVMKLDRAFQSSNTWGGDAIDQGGPYRDSFDRMCRDLMSNRVPLFTRTRNNISKTGRDRRDAWMPNPGARDERSLEMFRFVGKILGVAIRTREFLPLRLAPLVWAKLVGAPVTSGVLATSHLSVCKSMAELAGLRVLHGTQNIPNVRRGLVHDIDDKAPNSHASSSPVSAPPRRIHNFHGSPWKGGGAEVSGNFMNVLSSCYGETMVP